MVATLLIALAATPFSQGSKRVFPFTKPYQLLDAPAEAGNLASHIPSGEKGAAWLEGDVLTFLCHSHAKSVMLVTGIQEPMKQIPGSDLWILQAKMPGWEKGFVSYGFIEVGPNATELPKMTLWRGPNAPEQPERATTLKGKIEDRTIYSNALGEDRKLHIYLPPNAPKSKLPAIFLADGRGCAAYAAVLEPLILAHKVRPCAIVGIEHGGYRGDASKGYDPKLDMRGKEYAPGVDPERFDKHAKFFTDEVGAYVAKEFGVSTKREDRVVTGFSNGGALSAALAYRRPDFFGVSMPMSLGVPPTDPKPANLPKMYFVAGSLENFSESTKYVYEEVKHGGTECTFDLYVAGHDSAMWELSFSKNIQKCFPTHR